MVPRTVKIFSLFLLSLGFAVFAANLTNRHLYLNQRAQQSGLEIRPASPCYYIPSRLWGVEDEEWDQWACHDGGTLKRIDDNYVGSYFSNPCPPGNPAKSEGNADCDGEVNLKDFSLWVSVYQRVLQGQSVSQEELQAVDFSHPRGSSEPYGVSLKDFSSWMGTYQVQLSSSQPDDLQIENLQLPSVKNFSSSAFTGDSTINYPLSLPPAAGGLVPSLSLSYSSGSVQDMWVGFDKQEDWEKKFTNQGSQLGMGWNLSGVPQIVKSPVKEDGGAVEGYSEDG